MPTTLVGIVLLVVPFCLPLLEISHRIHFDMKYFSVFSITVCLFILYVSNRLKNK